MSLSDQLNSRRFKNWLWLWGIENRKYSINNIHYMLTQKSGQRTFLPQRYIDRCYGGGDNKVIRRTVYEAIAAVHDVLNRVTPGLLQEAARKEREAADYYITKLNDLGMWNELNWPSFRLLTFKHFIKEYSPTPTKPIWNWIELQYAMENYATQQNWQRESFSFPTLMDQYASRQDELDRKRRLNPAREMLIYRV